MKTLILKSNLVTAIQITDLFYFEKSCELDFQIEPWSLFKNTIFGRLVPKFLSNRWYTYLSKRCESWILIFGKCYLVFVLCKINIKFLRTCAVLEGRSNNEHDWPPVKYVNVLHPNSCNTKQLQQFFSIFCKKISNFLFWAFWTCLVTSIKKDNNNL